MKEFVAEVPRFFTKFSAENMDEAVTKLKEEAGNFVEDHATIEDITNKTLPTAKEAMTAQKGGLLHKIVNVYEMGKSISKAVGGQAYLGVGDADVFFSSNICESLGIKNDVKASFVSLGGVFGELAPKTTENTKIA